MDPATAITVKQRSCAHANVSQQPSALLGPIALRRTSSGMAVATRMGLYSLIFKLLVGRMLDDFEQHGRALFLVHDNVAELVIHSDATGLQEKLLLQLSTCC